MSAENPAVPLSSLGDDDGAYGAGETSAGVRVTRRRALGYSAVWRAVNLISGDIGRIPLCVYRRGEGGKTIDTVHPAYRLLRRKPNPYMTAFIFRRTLQAHALTEGNGYAYIVRNMVDGRPQELLLLDPDNTWAARVGGELWYVTQAPAKDSPRKRETLRIPATDMLHIRGLGFDGLAGYPVLRVLRDTIGKAIAARDYGTRYFANSARPGLVIEVPASMKEQAIRNMRESWERLHKGVDNAHRVGILRDGARLSVYDTNAKNAQLIENLNFDAREIANVFGVPAHKLGDPSRTAYNSLESENQSYLDDTLDGWFCAHEEECWDKLLSEEEKRTESHEILFTRRELARANLSARGAYYSQAVNGGWMSRDEVRREENLNPIPDGKGSVFTIPVNVAPAVAPDVAPPQDPLLPDTATTTDEGE